MYSQGRESHLIYLPFLRLNSALQDSPKISVRRCNASGITEKLKAQNYYCSRQASFNLTQLHEVNPNKIVISHQQCSLYHFESKMDTVICFPASSASESALCCCARHDKIYQRSYCIGGWIVFVCVFARCLAITSHIWTLKCCRQQITLLWHHSKPKTLLRTTGPWWILTHLFVPHHIILLDHQHRRR